MRSAADVYWDHLSKKQRAVPCFYQLLSLQCLCTSPRLTVTFLHLHPFDASNIKYQDCAGTCSTLSGQMANSAPFHISHFTAISGLFRAENLSHILHAGGPRHNSIQFHFRGDFSDRVGCHNVFVTPSIPSIPSIHFRGGGDSVPDSVTDVFCVFQSHPAPTSARSKMTCRNSALSR